MEIKVPEWAKEVIWYQIFPERFRNGDISNDPDMFSLKEGNISGWKTRDWGSDWYSLDIWEKKMGLFPSIFKRRYGGDLQGIIDKLDYLQKLGITGIYLNPVFQSPSLHKYDGSCFHHIDVHFGPDPNGDIQRIKTAEETDDPSTWVWTKADKLFLNLIKEIHKRNMKIIIDGVFNHSGRNFFAFEDILQNKKESKFCDWYMINNWTNENDDGFEYKGWWNLKSMPEFNRNENNFCIPYKQYLFSITERWMSPFGKPEDGIDGWRLDVAFCVPHGFWKEWRKVVKSINPNAYITAEIIDLAQDFLSGDEFDGVMNYQFAFCVSEFFIDKKNKILPTEFDSRLKKLRESYHYEINYVLQNLISSHDTSRLRTLIVNPDMNYRDWENHFHKSKLELNKNYRIDPGCEYHKKIHKLIVLFQMTYLGAPMIYYGDEVGMTGANDPDCRKPMLWNDVIYGKETHPFQNISFDNQPDIELYEFYQLLIKIRKKHKVLSRGEFETILCDDNNLVYGFRREFENQIIDVIINNSFNDYSYVMNTEHRDLQDILNNITYTAEENNEIEIIIPGFWAVILLHLP